MKKTALSLAALAFIAFSSHSALAASAKCTIKQVTDTTVTMDCGKKADKFSAGQQVKVKSAKKKAIEGC